MAWGSGEGSRWRSRRKENGDVERARERLREESASVGACETDLPRLVWAMVRPRDSLSSPLPLPLAELSRVLVRESDSEEKPPIMEVKDLKEPDARWLLSVGLRLREGELWWAEDVPLGEDSLSRACGKEVSIDERRLEVVGESEGVVAPLLSGNDTEEAIGDDGRLGDGVCSCFPSSGVGKLVLMLMLQLLDGRPLLLPGLGNLAVQLRFFCVVSPLMQGYGAKATEMVVTR